MFHDEHCCFLALTEHAHVAVIESDHRYFLAVAPTRW
jgi:hypothetical protein